MSHPGGPGNKLCIRTTGAEAFSFSKAVSAFCKSVLRSLWTITNKLTLKFKTTEDSVSGHLSSIPAFMHLEDHEGWENSLELPVCLGVNLRKGQGHFSSFGA